MISHTIELKRDQDPIAEQLFRNIPIINDADSYDQLRKYSSRNQQMHYFPDTSSGLEYIEDGRPLELVIIGLESFSLDESVRTIGEIQSLTSAPMIATTSASFYAEDRKDREEIAVLNAGAAYYLVKPSWSILEVRMAALIRRRNYGNDYQKDQRYKDAILDINLAKREVLVRGIPVDLTPTEYRLLLSLTRHLGRVVSFEELISEARGINYSYNGNLKTYVHSYMYSLRAKLSSASDPNQAELIRNVWGVGYRYESGSQTQ